MAAATAAATEDTAWAKSALVVDSRGRKRNLGPLLRASTAFGLKELIIVGNETYSTHGAHGSQHHVAVRSARHFDELQVYLAAEQVDMCALVLEGPEERTPWHGPAQDSALPAGPLALVIVDRSNRGDILPLCKYSVTVRHCTPPGLNLAFDDSTLACLALQRLCEWRALPQRSFQNEKFDVEPRGHRRHKKGVAIPLFDVESSSSGSALPPAQDSAADDEAHGSPLMA
jgi:hypothetical protein